MKISTYNFRELRIIYTHRKPKRPLGLVVYNWIMFYAVITPVIKTLVPIVTEFLLGFSASSQLRRKYQYLDLRGTSVEFFIPTAVDLSH